MSFPYHQQEIIDWLNATFIKHNWQSGEIIFEVEKVQPFDSFNAEGVITAFLNEKHILNDVPGFDLANQASDAPIKLIKIEREVAIASMDFGLSIKVNYTSVDIPFSDQLRQKIAQRFLDIFSNKKCYYTLPDSAYTFYRDKDPSNDFVHHGGCIITDGELIGILWVTDFY